MPKQASFTTSYKRMVNRLRNQVHIGKPLISEEPSNDAKLRTYTALWDTGATNTVITQRVVRECGLKPTGMAEVHHVGGSEIVNTYLISILLPSQVGFRELRATEGKDVLGGDVLIGMDVISQGDLAVSNYDKKTVFSFRIPSVEQIDFVEQLRKGQPARVPPKVGRNAPCPCGSGKKYKNCCLKK